jgi:hypothetical protein
MGGMFSKPKKQDTAQFVERPGVALLQDLPQYTEAANKATAARLAEIERVMPGATAQRQQASDITAAWMRGELPKDVQEQTMRSIAEYGGAGFNPATAGRAGGFQMAQGMVPRQFGLQSQQLQEKGMSTAAGWQQLADAFAYDPFEAAQFAGPSQRFGESKSAAAAKDEATYQQAVATQQKNIMGAVTGLASIAAAPLVAPALFGGLASGAAGLGLGTTAQAGFGSIGTGLAGGLQSFGRSLGGQAAAQQALSRSAYFGGGY